MIGVERSEGLFRKAGHAAIITTAAACALTSGISHRENRKSTPPPTPRQTVSQGRPEAPQENYPYWMIVDFQGPDGNVHALDIHSPRRAVVPQDKSNSVEIYIGKCEAENLLTSQSYCTPDPSGEVTIYNVTNIDCMNGSLPSDPLQASDCEIWGSNI